MAKGRGRLSNIDRLPPEADPHVQWVAAELIANKRDQKDILADFNRRLATLGCGPISSSSFGRHAVDLWETVSELQEMRDLSAAVVERLGPDTADDVTIMLVDLIKTATRRVLRRDREDITSKELSELSRALLAAASAQKVSADMRRTGLAELRAKAERATEAAADGIVASTPGADRQAVLRKIREEVYGIIEP